MEHYDGAIIRTFASKLYTRATWGLFLYPVVLGAVGGVAGTFAGRGLGLIGGVCGALVGYFLASQRAFQLRLLAQTALCQVQIEENTRHTRFRAAEPTLRMDDFEEASSKSAYVAPVQDSVARLVAAGCRVNRADRGGWEITRPSGASVVANSPEELSSLAAELVPMNH